MYPWPPKVVVATIMIGVVNKIVLVIMDVIMIMIKDLHLLLR